LFLGGASIAKLRDALNGFSLAEIAYHIPESKRLGGFDEEAFEQWVLRKNGLERYSASGSLKSFGLAAELAGSDSAGFERWFEWFDEYQRTLTTAAG
jgi:hypothetical protein